MLNKAAVIAVVVLAAVLALSCVAVPAKEEPKAPAGKTKPNEVIGKYDFMKVIWKDGQKTILLKGSVKFTHDDTAITSDQVDYDDAANTAVSPGKLVISNPECDITGARGSAFFKKRLGIVEGSVVMNLKPRKDETEPADSDSVRARLNEPTTITCSRLEYLYRDKIVTATGQVVFRQNKRKATADKVIYDQKNEFVTLTGNVSMIDEDGQTFSAPKVTMSVKKGDEWMEAPSANATFKIDLGEDEE